MLYFAIVIFLEMLAGCEIDLFVPSLPNIQQDFGLTPFMAELTLAVNLVPYCVMSLVAGNMGDKYGRKPVMLWGLALFIVGSALCLWAGSFTQLLWGRFLQGVGIAGPAVLCYIVVADIFSQERQQEIVGIMHGVVTLAMAISPLVGSYVNLYFQWRGNFTFLLIFGILSFAATLLLPHGMKHPEVRMSMKEYWPLVCSKRLWLYTLPICCGLAAYWVFLGMAPILYMEDLGVPLNHFGYYQGALAGSFALLSLVAGLLMRQVGRRLCLIGSVVILMVFLISSCALVLLEVSNPVIITGVAILLSLGSVFPINILWPMSLEVVPNAKARISGYAVAMKMILTAFGVQLVSYLYDGTFFWLGLFMITFVVFALGTGWILIKQEKFV